MKQNARAATAAEIVEIFGPLDDAVLIRIVQTKASPAEVLEAFTWATADDQIGTELEHRPARCRCPGLRHPQARGIGVRRAQVSLAQGPVPLLAHLVGPVAGRARRPAAATMLHLDAAGIGGSCLRGPLELGRGTRCGRSLCGDLRGHRGERAFEYPLFADSTASDLGMLPRSLKDSLRNG